MATRPRGFRNCSPSEVTQGIFPAQAFKAHEVVVAGDEDSAVADRQRGQMRVGRQVARCTRFFQ
jgi:hypothetical protein